jgi:hypothetical protein
MFLIENQLELLYAFIRGNIIDMMIYNGKEIEIDFKV